MPTNKPIMNDIQYTAVRRARKRNITITVSLDGNVVVSGPKWATNRDFAAAVQAKQDWIRSKLSEFAQQRSQIQKRRFENGESIPYLGQPLTIVRREDMPRAAIRIEVSQDHLIIHLPSRPLHVDSAPAQSLYERDWRDELVTALQQFYVQSGKAIIPQRVALYAPLLCVHPNRITVKNQKRRWGSCNPQNRNLNFNWRLMMSPLWVLDYVVVHELAHLVHANHSKAFWDTVAGVYPKWRDAKQWLHAHGLDLTLTDAP